MRNDRRDFIKKATLATGSLIAAGSMPSFGLGKRWWEEAEEASRSYNLTILHTNDVHSRLEAFPMDGSRNQGLGGVAARSELIRQIRAEESNVLLLDAGDIFQGTPYFNVYKGEPEIKAMTAMGYDAATMGNHDFDAGLDNFATQLQHAQFPIIVCNYDFSGTPMEYKYQPYKIFRKGKLKIGVLGVGIELTGLVPDSLFGKTKYLDPIQKANETAAMLKTREGCDLVICLSHLGYKYGDNKVSDRVLAAESDNIDVIIGGHTHTFMDTPEVLKNKNHHEVIVNQVGWAGIMLGRIDIHFDRTQRKKQMQTNTVVVGKKTRE
jgi:5'-nucleotidase